MPQTLLIRCDPSTHPPCFTYNTILTFICQPRSNFSTLVTTGDFCDKNDHNLESNVNLETEVVIPFLMSSFYLSGFYEVNLDELFSARLVSVRNKYVGQPNYKKSD